MMILARMTALLTAMALSFALLTACTPTDKPSEPVSSVPVSSEVTETAETAETENPDAQSGESGFEEVIDDEIF